MVGRTRKRIYDDEGDGSESSAERADVIIPGIPLGYESLKCVLQYLEPNRRIEASRRIPSIRPTERMVPLRINKLKLEENSVTINRVTYSIGIAREFKNTDQPEQDNDDESKIRGWVAREKREGGMPYGIDEYGHRNFFDEVLAPGDISFLEQPRANMTREEGERDMPRLTNAFRSRARTFSRCGTRSWEGTRLEMVWARIYFMKRFLENRPRPFEYFLQFSIREREDEREEGQVKQRWRIPYDAMKLYEACKTLTTTLFHHDTIQVDVDRLNIISSTAILRLPRDLKFRIRSVNIKDDASRILILLKPIISESSFPLETLETYSMHNLNLPVIRNDFKTLVICGMWYRYREEDYDNFPKVTHIQYGQEFSFLNLLRRWVRNPKNVGTCLTAGMISTYAAEKVLKLLMKGEDREEEQTEFQFVIREKRHLTLHLENRTTINITAKANPIPSSDEKWMVKFEVMPMELN